MRDLDNEVLSDFTSRLESAEKSGGKPSPALAAIETLYSVVVKHSHASTVTELTQELRGALGAMERTDHSNIAVKSAGELFMRFISLASLEQPDFEECKKVLVERGRLFVERVASSRRKICRHTMRFIRNGKRIFVHGHSGVVADALKAAAQSSAASFQVFVTESRPDEAGRRMKAVLDAADIPTILVLDAAVGSVMESVDLVLLGAEAVVETGGIINKIGSLNVAFAAKLMKKPLYVLCESVKFIREYPLNQRDVPDDFKYPWSVRSRADTTLTEVHADVDYTPPEFIHLLFTDLGILTPAAVSEELIKLYL